MPERTEPLGGSVNKPILEIKRHDLYTRCIIKIENQPFRLYAQLLRLARRAAPKAELERLQNLARRARFCSTRAQLELPKSKQPISDLQVTLISSKLKYSGARTLGFCYTCSCCLPRRPSVALTRLKGASAWLCYANFCARTGACTTEGCACA